MTWFRTQTLITVVVLLASCGGGSGGSDTPTAETPNPTPVATTTPPPTSTPEPTPTSTPTSTPTPEPTPTATATPIFTPSPTPTPIVIDTDGDGIPDTSDDDDDNDGTPDDLDAFPLDNTESSDSDEDGVGDNADAYPTQPLCQLDTDGNGDECYLTSLAKRTITHVTASDNGIIYFYLDAEHQLISYDLATHRFTAIDLPVGTESQLTNLFYSQEQMRVYLGFSTGLIAYVDQESLELQRLTKTSNRLVKVMPAGNLILAQTDSGWGKQSIFDRNGLEIDTLSTGYMIGESEWDPINHRIYFFIDDNYPSELFYWEINQLTGTIGDTGSVSNITLTSFQQQISLSPDGKSVFVAPNFIYSSEKLEVNNVIKVKSQNNFWTAAGNLVMHQKELYDTQLSAFNAQNQLIDKTRISGRLIHAFVLAGINILVLQDDEELKFKTYAVNSDYDNDGVNNIADQFPNNPAASVDSDNDGAPDNWNDGYTSGESTPELSLDAFPQDAICQKESHGAEGECDIKGRVNLLTSDKIIISNDIAYMLSIIDRRINRWNLLEDSAMNPILLGRITEDATPTTFAIDESQKIIVGFDSGELYEYNTAVNFNPLLIKTMPGSVTHITIDTPRILAVAGGEGLPQAIYSFPKNQTQSAVITRRKHLDTYDHNFTFSKDTRKLFWFSDRENATVAEMSIDGENEFWPVDWHYFNRSGADVLSVSKDGSLIVIGNGQFREKGVYSPNSTLLPTIDGLSNQAVLQHFEWLNKVAVAVFKNGGDNLIAVYSKDLKKAYGILPLDTSFAQLASYAEGIIAVHDNDTGVGLKFISVEGDEDADGLPLWWEKSHGFSDTDSADAFQDADEDGLNNIEEFNAGTAPNNQDTDSDGLLDGVEVEAGINPLAADTDEDTIPDAWEFNNGLDPLNPADAAADNDADGYNNLIEYLTGKNPQDPDSAPTPITNTLLSFEDNLLPTELVAEGEVAFSDGYAQDGTISLSSQGNLTLSWKGYFGATEFSVFVNNDCYDNQLKRIQMNVDGKTVSSLSAPQERWTKLQTRLSMGVHTIEIDVQSSTEDCNIYIDTIHVEPLASLHDIGAEIVSQEYRQLYVYNIHRELQYNIEIPEVIANAGTPKAVAITDDGHIAVFNGESKPVLSLYTPERNSWKHIKAPAWSSHWTMNTGSLVVHGDKILANNLSDYQSERSGIVEFDIKEDRVRYIDLPDIRHLALGLDGYLYALGEYNLHKLDPVSYSEIKSIPIDSLARSIAIDENGDIFQLIQNNLVKRTDNDGKTEASVTFENAIARLKIRDNGTLYIVANMDKVFLVDKSLQPISTLALKGNDLAFIPNADTDADGIPDWWENSFGLDYDDDLDAINDLDNDGLSALEEYMLGTHENNIDTDQDSLSDGDEHLIHLTNPLSSDSDRDTLLDNEEITLGTNPNSTDTDSDGLTDAEEIETLLTSPTNADTDDDGIEDGYEVEFNLDPFVDDADSDFDEDQLTNLQEFEQGTNPRLADTDGDLLTDSQEVLTHFTSPLMADTDQDRIPDGWEILYQLDANDPSDAPLDQDLDQFTAFEEYYSRTNPNDAQSYPLPVEWGNVQGSASHRGYSPVMSDPTKFQLKWQRRYNEITSSLSIASKATTTNGRLFFISRDSNYNPTLVAVDSNSGDIAWQYTPNEQTTLHPPATANGKVYMLTTRGEKNYLRALDAETGNLVFSQFNGDVNNDQLAPTIYGDTIYSPGANVHGISAYTADEGTKLWSINELRYSKNTPAVDEKYVYSYSNMLNVYHRPTGMLAFQIPFSEAGWGSDSWGVSPTLTGLQNVVVTTNGSIVAFDTKTQSILWQRASSGYRSPAVAANGVIYTRDYDSLEAIDELTGDTIWRVDEIVFQNNLIATRGHIFASDYNTTYAIDIHTHQIVWSYPFSGTLSLDQDGTLYISGGTVITAIKLN